MGEPLVLGSQDGYENDQEAAKDYGPIHAPDRADQEGSIERIRCWFDRHPRTHWTVRTSLGLLSAAIYVVAWLFGGAIIGFGTGLALLYCVAVVTSGVVDLSGTDTSLWNELGIRAFVLLVVIGAIIFAVRAIYRVAGPSKDGDHRSRRETARYIVGQAVVAHQLGLDVERLRLGLIEGGELSCTGSLWFSHSGSGKWPNSEISLRRRKLAVAVSRLVDGAMIWPFQLKSEQRNVLEIADEIQLEAALGGVQLDRAELLAQAARTARDALEQVPDERRELIEDELRLAGMMRGERFRELLDVDLAAGATSSPERKIKIFSGSDMESRRVPES